MPREKTKCMMDKTCEAGNKGLRVKRKGARAKEKVKRFKRGSKVADSAQGEKMNEVFFWKICRRTTNDYGKKYKEKEVEGRNKNGQKVLREK